MKNKTIKCIKGVMMVSSRNNIFSVIVCIYNNSLNDVLMTLDSILRQKEIEIQVIIADDCSEEDYHNDINSFFYKNDFENYLYIKNEKNLGTVKNILNALNYCKGKYVKIIGAGDLLYDQEVLHTVCKHMEENHLDMCFGKAKAYVINDEGFKTSRFYSPYIVTPYINNDQRKIKMNLVVFGDQISGSVSFHTKDFLFKYLCILKDRVIYVEDYMPRMAIIDNKRIGFLNEFVVLYQYGLGISTRKNKKNNERLLNDEKWFTELISEYQTDNLYINMYNKFYQLKKLNAVSRVIKKTLIQPRYLIYYIKTFFIRKMNFSFWKLENNTFQNRKGKTKCK